MNTETDIASDPDRNSHDSASTCVLRILSTTDIHAHLLGFDYIKDCPAPGSGLAGVAQLIEEARAEAAAQGAACILVDNGDTLQGTPLGDTLATTPPGHDHAIVNCFNHLQYDAVGVGNHDLDQGLPYLRSFAKALNAPVVCSNLSGVDLGDIHRKVVIDTPLPDGTSIKIGVLSLLPLLTQIWNSLTLGEDAQIENLADSLKEGAALLRMQDADLVLVLAHMGVGLTANLENTEAGALALAQVPGIDVLITGHTHRRFPAKEFEGQPGVDVAGGSLGSVPTLMAGHAGSDLGVLDLRLRRDPNGGWHLRAHQGALRPNTAETPPAPDIERLAAPAHQTTRDRLSQNVGQTDVSVHSYFCLAQPSRLTRTVALAKAEAIARTLEGTPEGKLPLIASAAARNAGGRDGSDQFVHIPPGPVLRRHIAGLNPYSNRIIGAVVTGEELRGWAENAARAYAANETSSALLNPDRPRFHFDTLYGLQYDIDLSKPPGERINCLHFNGAEVAQDTHFVVATSDFRLAGGGGYVPLPRSRIVAQSDMTLETALIETLAGKTTPHWAPDPPWRLTGLDGRHFTYDTGLGAHAYLGDIADLKPKVLGPTDAGFLRLELSF